MVSSNPMSGQLLIKNFSQLTTLRYHRAIIITMTMHTKNLRVHIPCMLLRKIRSANCFSRCAQLKSKTPFLMILYMYYITNEFYNKVIWTYEFDLFKNFPEMSSHKFHLQSTNANAIIIISQVLLIFTLRVKKKKICIYDKIFFKKSVITFND